MLSVYICDDDPFWLECLDKAVSDYQIKSDLEIRTVYKTASPSLLLQHLSEHPSINGIFLLDIDLKDSISGLTLAAQIREMDSSASLIIVTIHDEMARETFRLKLEVLDYIEKDKNNLSGQLYQCLEHIERRLSQQPKRKKTIFIHESGSYKLLYQDEIYFLETVKNSHKVCIHLYASMHMVSACLSSIQEQLGDDFVQCHKICLVNIRHIRELHEKDRQLILDNGESCSCSVRQWKEIVQAVKAQSAGHSLEK